MRFRGRSTSGVDINSWIPENGTPLGLAAEHGNLETIKYLINAGANVNATNYLKSSWAAFHAASKHGKWAAAKFLLEYGADFRINSHGTALFEACGLERRKCRLKWQKCSSVCSTRARS
jgi:ankyrin repeat protein